MSYKTLLIWQESRDLSIAIHHMSLGLPVFEPMEVGRQIRRSSKSVRSNIVEGYGRKRYKMDYIKFMVYAIASCDETIDHLETLFETGSLSSEALFEDLHKRYNLLDKKLINFLKALEK